MNGEMHNVDESACMVRARKQQQTCRNGSLGSNGKHVVVNENLSAAPARALHCVLGQRYHRADPPPCSAQILCSAARFLVHFSSTGSILLYTVDNTPPYHLSSQPKPSLLPNNPPHPVMTIKQASWTHGLGIELESRSWTVLCQGFYTTVTPSNESQAGWVHFVFLSPVVINSVRSKVDSARIKFTTGPAARITNVHVYRPLTCRSPAISVDP
ncbi:MAG: hypothetical protein J3Q66DRAFT_129041 [Benniella sp.]|nr:MAG: hypothetical protein J3Q66DRAFT_129041 [Benniella sp.]